MDIIIDDVYVCHFCVTSRKLILNDGSFRGVNGVCVFFCHFNCVPYVYVLMCMMRVCVCVLCVNDLIELIECGK